MSDPLSIQSALEEFDRSFASGDLDALVSLFSEDAVVLFHSQPAIAGRAQVRDVFGEVFAAFDTSDYEARYDAVETHAEAAYVMGDIVEVLRPHRDGWGVRIHARVVLFLRRDDASWVITRLLTGRAAADEQLPDPASSSR